MGRLTPLRAIRARCLDCSETAADVRTCECPDCPLYRYRHGHLPEDDPRRPLKAIRAYCLWCCDDSSTEVSVCHPLDCPLREFRRGKNPARARTAKIPAIPGLCPPPPSHVRIPAPGMMLEGHPCT